MVMLFDLFLGQSKRLQVRGKLMIMPGENKSKMRIRIIGLTKSVV